LPVHQPLRPLDIFNPGETVLVLPITDLVVIHHARQPFPAIQTNLDRKRQPGLDTSVHPAEIRIHPVVIDEQTFAQRAYRLQFLRLLVAMDLKAHTGFHTRQDGDQTRVGSCLWQQSRAPVSLYR
jgi:hypothetical protein